MTRNHGAGGNPPGAIGGWKGSLAAVLKAHNGARQDGAVASFATQDKRSDVLYAGFKSLRALGFRMDTVMGLRGKHIEALAKDWHARGLSASTLHNNLSIFRRCHVAVRCPRALGLEVGCLPPPIDELFHPQLSSGSRVDAGRSSAAPKSTR